MNFDILTLIGTLITLIVTSLLIGIHRSNEKITDLHLRMRGCGVCR